MFGLPSELRNRIYYNVLPTATKVSVLERVGTRNNFILRTCRAIRKEAVPIFYGNCTFSCDIGTTENYQLAKAWLNALPTDVIASLRKIYFQSELFCYCKDSETACRATALRVWVDQETGSLDKALHRAMDGKHEKQNGSWGVNTPVCQSADRYITIPCPGITQILERIDHSMDAREVQREDLDELLRILRHISSFEFSIR